VKVAERGQTLADDVARVAAVRAVLGPGGRVRVDANGGWSVRDAVAAISELRGFDLEYVEQPVATVEELREVRRLVDVPVAADESIRRSGDPMRVKLLEAADIAVLKVQPLGGARACLELAESVALPVVVSSALESSVGIGFGVALAAALPSLPYACGLATTSMLTHDVTRSPLSAEEGHLPVRRVLPDDDLVAAATPDESVTARWLARLQRCAGVLQERHA
jgi:O-succinylbenzoate synthase